MARFSATDAAMAGFGVVRQRPMVLVWWTLLHILLTGGFSVLMVTMAGPAMTQMMALQGASLTPDPQTQAQKLEILRQLAPFYLLMFPLTIVFYSVVYTAVNRAVLRPAKGGFGYLRLGVDELRQFGLFVLTWIVLLGAYIGTIICALLLGFGIALLGRAAGADASTAVIMRVVAVAAPIVLSVCGWIYVATRLSLASPLTFDTRKVNLFGSWRITRHQFWPMFGAYVLTAFLALVVGLLGMIVLLACAAIAAGGLKGFAFMFRPDMSSLAAYLSPARIIYLVLAGALYALVWPVLLAPRAAIYKALTAPKPTPASWPARPPLEPPGPGPFGVAPGDPAPL